jgi:hypothetical protein
MFKNLDDVGHGEGVGKGVAKKLITESKQE